MEDATSASALRSLSAFVLLSIVGAEAGVVADGIGCSCVDGMKTGKNGNDGGAWGQERAAAVAVAVVHGTAAYQELFADISIDVGWSRWEHCLHSRLPSGETYWGEMGMIWRRTPQAENA